MINALLMLYDFLGNNFVLAIAVFTILIRLLTLPLNLRQQRFAEEYVIDGNGTQAAIRAGYSDKGADVTAIRLLGNLRIAAEIRRLEAAREERTAVSQDWVIERLVRIVDNGMQQFAVKGKDGEPTGLMALFDATAALNALEKLGKHLGMFRDKVDHYHFIQQVKELARENGIDEVEAVAEAERYLAAQR